LYLYWKARKYGFNSRFIRLAADLNHAMPHYVIGRIEAMLAAQKKTLRRARILVVGVTYKKDVRDLRKSPALRLLEMLKTRCHTDYHDPVVPYLDIGGLKMDSVPLTPAAVAGYDALVIAVDHTRVDYAMIARRARAVFDVKNVFGGKRYPHIEVL
jgi:UDP-N-acetyl-D-glucosamine dehydrogenase